LSGQEAPIPQQVYCDKCIDVEGKPYTLSGSDGSFSFDAPTEDGWLVIQKGAFRVARFMKPVDGANAVPKTLTTLPKSQGAYEDIPRIAVVGDAFDGIENTLAKLGLGMVDSWGELIYGTESFDLYNEGDGNEPDGEELLKDYATLSQYHIVFFPCEDWYQSLLDQPQVSENLKKYVETGGRIYATDGSYDVLNVPFPKPIEWFNESAELGSATVSVYDAPVASLDKGLEDWLAVQAIGDFELIDNFTIIDELHDYTAPDENGKMTLMTPRTWVSADIDGHGIRPSTVTFQYGCGRAMFSTYHTEGEEDVGLMAQERALLYVILEVAVCVGEIPKPPK